jgi:hypothetical protein
VLRTLVTADFDSFVEQAIQLRQKRIIAQTKQAVEILPEFAAKLQSTSLTSGKEL